jgi:hypothetical protein
MRGKVETSNYLIDSSKTVYRAVAKNQKSSGQTALHYCFSSHTHKTQQPW